MTSKIERSMDYDALLAEIYDQSETGVEDVNLILTLLQGSGPLNILECFSGTGRIFVPLACESHTVTGIDISEAMTARAYSKLAALSKEIQEQITLVLGDVLVVEWGKGYDVVILGGNCLFELSSAEAQEECIRRASKALIPGGYVFVDNDDASGVDPSDIGTGWTSLEGTCADGTYIKTLARVVDVDVTKGVKYLIRTRYQRLPDGTATTVEYAACKRPVGGDEVEAWLRKYGFEILKRFGGRGSRARFWARLIKNEL